MYIPLNDLSELFNTLESGDLRDDEYWLIMLADKHAPQLELFVNELNSKGVNFCGAIFPGLIVDKRTFYEGALIRKIRCLSEPTCILMPSDNTCIEQFLPKYSEIPESGATCLTYVDCLSLGIDDLLTQLYNRFNSRCSYFGAGAGCHDLSDQACIFGAWGVAQKAALVVIINQPSKSVARHGWVRHSGPTVASRTTGNVLHELDWEGAEIAYRNALPEKLRNTPPERFYKDVTPRYPFAVEHLGSEDVVRDPIFLFGNGDVMFLSDIPQGALMYLVEGSPDKLIEAAREAVEETITASTKDLLVCDCLSRTTALDSKFPAELRTIYKQVNSIKPDTSVEGVIALGEIASNGDSPVNFYNKTFGICCFQ